MEQRSAGPAWRRGLAWRSLALGTLLPGVVVAAAGLYVVAYLGAAAARMGYPFELEWMEGAMVDHVRRVLAGRGLYGPPSLEFTPFNYPPVYFWVSAAASAVLGVGFLPLRLVSFVSSLGCLWLVYLVVWRETSDRVAGVVGLGLFAAIFPLGGAWLDVARVDSLYLLLLLVLLYAVRFGASMWWVVAAGVVAGVAFHTKQSAVLAAAPVMCYAVLADWRRGLVFAGTAVGLMVGAVVVLDVVHGGWYTFYIFRVPLGHEMVPQRWRTFWTRDLLRPLPVACGLGLWWLVCEWRRGVGRRALFYTLASAGMVGSAYATRLYAGAFRNVLLSSYAMVAVLFGLGLHGVAGWSESGGGRRRRVAAWGVYVLCVVQFAVLFYDPRLVVPTRGDLAAGRGLIHTLSALEGEVYVVSHGYLPVLAGKASRAHVTAVNDVLRSGTAVGARLREEVGRALRERRFGSLVCDENSFGLQGWIARHYVVRAELFADERVFWPIAGFRTRPEVVRVPR